ncbi:MAG: phosphohistidine phosphatase SixA [Myxococcota bacterium]
MSEAITIYLLRHAEAEEGGYDAYRPLTGAGRARMRRTADLFAAEMGPLDLILSSPLVRAVQTAEILAGAIAFTEPLLIAPEIATPPKMSSLTDLFDGARADVQGLALVGHEPILGALVGDLLKRPAVSFRRGEIYALRRDRTAKTTSFLWRITPDGPTRMNDLER